MNLEQAVSEIIEGKRRLIRPQNSKIYNKSLEHYIQTLQNAPRDQAALNEWILKNKQARNSCADICARDWLLVELEALLHMWSLVMRKLNGMPLEGLAY